MTDRALDSERIAAFLDGRLSAAEREQVIAQLGDNPELREALVEAAAALAEVDGDTSKGDVDQTGPAAATLRTDPQPSVRRWRFFPVALAATVVGAVGLSMWFSNRGRDEALLLNGGPLRVAMAAAPTLELTASRLDDRWTTTRSARAGLPVSAASVRLGVLAVDLLAAWRKADSVASLNARDEMLHYLSDVSGSAPAASALRVSGDSASTVNALLAIRAVVDQSAFDLGVLIELGRLGDAAAMLLAARDGMIARTASQLAPNDSRALQLARNAQEQILLGTTPTTVAPVLDSLLRAVAR